MRNSSMISFDYCILARKLLGFIVSDSNFADIVKIEQIRPGTSCRIAKRLSPLQMAKLLLDIGEVCHEND